MLVEIRVIDIHVELDGRREDGIADKIRAFDEQEATYLPVYPQPPQWFCHYWRPVRLAVRLEFVLTIAKVLFRADDVDGGCPDLGTHFAAGKNNYGEGSNDLGVYAINICFQAKSMNKAMKWLCAYVIYDIQCSNKALYPFILSDHIESILTIRIVHLIIITDLSGCLLSASPAFGRVEAPL